MENNEQHKVDLGEVKKETLMSKFKATSTKTKLLMGIVTVGIIAIFGTVHSSHVHKAQIAKQKIEALKKEQLKEKLLEEEREAETNRSKYAANPSAVDSTLQSSVSDISGVSSNTHNYENLGKNVSGNGGPDPEANNLNRASRGINGKANHRTKNMNDWESEREGPQSGGIANHPSGPASAVSDEIAKRLNGNYQAMVGHFKATAGMGQEVISGAAYDKLKKDEGDSKKIAGVEDNLQHVDEDWYKPTTGGNEFEVMAGSRIVAITMQEISSDHPGYFTGKVSSPQEIAGYTLLCKSSGNTRDRIPVTVEKMISPKGKEHSVAGEPEMGFPGLTGDITVHYIKRILPAVANAAIGGLAGYYYYTHIASQAKGSDSSGQRINTADAVVGPAYNSGVQGVQNEIGRFGEDAPNTVDVPVGTKFDILVTNSFKVEGVQ